MNYLTQTTGEYVLNFFKQFIGTPAILIALFALLGCILQRKKFTDTLGSTIKTAVGFLIIGGGAGILSNAVGKLGSSFNLLFGVNGIVANNDSIPGIFLQKIPGLVTAGALIMIVAMFLNILLARITGFKYIYLTGHVLFYMSVMFASIMGIAGLNYTTDLGYVVVSGALFMSAWMIFSPALLNKHVITITKSESLAMGHSGSLSYFFAGWIGILIEKMRAGRIRSTESIYFPKWLAFLRNTNVAIALTMLVVYLIVYFTTWGVRGYDEMVQKGIINAGDDVFVQGLLQALTFAAGVEVLLIGVRMFIAEIVPAFKGISERFVPNSKPALDCPTVFPYAPNAVLIGFVCSFIGGIIGMAITIGIVAKVGHHDPLTIGWAVVIPGIVPHFFLGATSAVFANSRGGLLAAVIASFLNGLIITFVPFLYFGLGYIQNEVIGHNSAGPILNNMVWGDSDYLLGLPIAAIGIAVGSANAGWVLLVIAIVLWLIAPCIHGVKFYISMRNVEFRAAYHKAILQRRLDLKAAYAKRKEMDQRRYEQDLQMQQKRRADEKAKQEIAYQTYQSQKADRKAKRIDKKGKSEDK